MSHKHLPSIFLVAGLIGCGAFSDDEEITSQSGPSTLTPSVAVAACANVQDPWADSMMAAGNALANQSFEDMGNHMSDGQWGSMNEAVPTSAVAHYDQVLVRHPGHCGAQFARALTGLARLAGDPDITQTMDDLDGESESISMPMYMNASPEEAAQILVKTSLAANSADPMTVTRFQTTLENKALPAVDTAIALLESVMKQEDFSFDMEIGERQVQFDRGEVGPALAALKYIKALLVVLVSVEAEIALDGNYDWISVLDDMNDSDFDNLTPQQTQALDHLTTMFNASSVITTIKPRWRSAYSSIPAYLVTAIADLQDGLQHGVLESSMDFSVQENDLYVVGTGPQADVHPEDLVRGIADLERLKKYLLGEVTIPYARGTRTLRVNVPAFFRIHEGMQDLLPYHRILPYAEWNDTVRTDTTWSSYSAEPSVLYIEAETKGPFVFTDAQGNATFGAHNASAIEEDIDRDGLRALTNLVVFPDPTFGGVFPGLTNANIWETLESLEQVQSRTESVCEEYYDEYYGYSYTECSRRILPSNPSDLDILTYYIN